MVTYGELFQFCLVIIGVISLCLTFAGVFSDKALPVDAADDTTPGGNVTNPDTGANDVVGIATARRWGRSGPVRRPKWCSR